MAKEIVLTSRLGQFTFQPYTKLSLAKLIRDTVTGQYFNPKKHEVSVKDSDTATELIKSVAGPASGVTFELSIG